MSSQAAGEEGAHQQARAALYQPNPTPTLARNPERSPPPGSGYQSTSGRIEIFGGTPTRTPPPTSGATPCGLNRPFLNLLSAVGAVLHRVRLSPIGLMGERQPLAAVESVLPSPTRGISAQFRQLVAHGTPDDPRLVLIGVDIHAAVFLEADKPQPVVLYELVKGWLTGTSRSSGRCTRSSLVDESARY